MSKPVYRLLSVCGGHTTVTTGNILVTNPCLNLDVVRVTRESIAVNHPKHYSPLPLYLCFGLPAPHSTRSYLSYSHRQFW